MNSPLTFARKPWTYGRAVKDRAYLQADSDFESLVGGLGVALASATSQDVRFRLEPTNGKYGSDDPLLKRLQCRRASWAIRLCPKLLDKFFNGHMGIRAQYYLSPYHGGAMNARLLSALRPRLLVLAREAAPSADRDVVELSLAATSAKTWICEKDLSGQKIIRASDLALVEDEIQNDWLDLARAVKAGAAPQGQYQLYSAALNGVRAPSCHSRLRGFLQSPEATLGARLSVACRLRAPFFMTIGCPLFRRNFPSQSGLRPLCAAAHVERSASRPCPVLCE